MGEIGELAQTGWEYTLDDFLHTTGPYEEVYRNARDPFLHERMVNAMAAYASSIGFRTFKGVYKTYCESLKMSANTIYVDNATDFTDQPVELNAGNWEADDTGISRLSGFGQEMACPHPVMPVERLVNIDTGVEKLVLAYRKGRNWREIIVEKSTLASSQKITSLADRGIAVTSETARAFVSYISDLENLNYDIIPERKSIGRLGYIPCEGFSPYVDGLIFDGDANFRNLFQAVRSGGSFDAWADTARECRKMSTTARVMLAASFASPLLEPLGALPFFVHLWGVDSGTGKTVALMLAASVWGDPAVGSYIKTFDATVVGHEKTAAFLNHLPLCLDELQLAKDAKGRMQFDVYKLAQGVGRTRGNKSGGVDTTPTWRNCILTTGESPLTSTSAGAGAVNRVIDIECRSTDAVITDGMRIAGALKANYGHAGKMFVDRIYGIEGALDAVKEAYLDTFKRLSSRDTTEKQAMAAAAILVADRLATGWFFDDGLQLTDDDISEFLASKAAVSAGERGYQYLCDWVTQNAHRLCRNSDTMEVLGALDGGYAYIVKSAFDKVAEEAGFSTRALISYLKQKDLIYTRGRNNTRGKTINGINTECICLRLPALDSDDVSGEFL